MDLLISVSSGVKNSVVDRVLVIAAGDVVQYGKALEAIPPEVEAWWSTHAFKLQGKPCPVVYKQGRQGEHPCAIMTDHRHRAQEFWESSSGVMLDLDLKCDGAKTSWADTEKTKELLNRMNNLLITASPPGNLYHFTPSGMRLIFVFPEPISDLNLWKQAAAGAAELTRKWLIENDAYEKKAVFPGLDVDPTVTKDSARLCFTPYSIAKDVPRRNPVVLLDERPSNAAYLLAFAPVALPKPAKSQMSDERKAELQARIDKWNDEHEAEDPAWPWTEGPCPTGHGDACFGPVPGTDGRRWRCFGGRHPQDLGVYDGQKLYSGTAIDLAMHRAGVEKVVDFLKKYEPVEDKWEGMDNVVASPPPGAINIEESPGVSTAEEEFFPGEGEDGQVDVEKREDIPKVTDKLAYIVSAESYFITNPDGSWNFTSPVGKESARKYLISLGYNAKEAGKVLFYNRHVFAVGAGCAPGMASTYEEQGSQMLNTHVRPKLAPKRGEWKRVEAVLRNVVNADVDPGAYDWLVNWCAWKVQNQGAPSLIAVVASGEQGTGKSLSGRFMQEILGRENTATIGQNQLSSRFTASFAAKLFILANEVMTRENLREMSNHMKSLIADSDVMLEGKGANAFCIRNSMSWWITSNEPIPVRIEGDADRHYTIFNQPNKPSNEFKAVTRSLFDGPNFNQGAIAELAAFADFLYHYKTDKDRAVEPHINDVRVEVSDATVDSVESFCREIEEIGFEMLVKQYFPSNMSFAESEPFMDGWDTAVEGGATCPAVYAVYRRWCKRNNADKAHAFNKFGLLLKRARPKWADAREKEAPRRRLYLVPRQGTVL